MLKIGILMRKDKNITGRNVYIVYNSLLKILHNTLVIPICPSNSLENIKALIDNLDGVILGGGSDYDTKDLEITKYLFDKNIPTLGICLGMQMMSMLFSGEMRDAINHNVKGDYVHDVFINKDSKLYSILKTDVIKVNSRHNSMITKTLLDITALSSDNVIEAVEAKNKRFFIGVEWHPEDLNDINTQNLIKSFLKESEKNANK